MLKLGLVLLAVCSVASYGSDIRVRSTEGVPRIEVDGQAVRSRWFWGGMGGGIIQLAKGPQEITINMLPVFSGDTNVTFHFRFPIKNGRYLIDRFRVIDETDGSVLVPEFDFEKDEKGLAQGWNYFPRDERNTVGSVDIEPNGGVGGSHALRVDLKNPPRGTRGPDFHVYTIAKVMKLKAGHVYSVRFWIDSLEQSNVTFGAYRPASPSFVRAMQMISMGGDKLSLFQRQLKHAKEVGVDFISPACNAPWVEPGKEPDMSGVDAVMQQILAVNPNAKVVPRLGTNPPGWWLQQNPGEMMKWDSKVPHVPHVSVSSRKWRECVAENLRVTIEYLEKNYPNNMAGYHPGGQNTSEWFYRDSWGQDYHGYSVCEREAFRRWLERRYKTDAALSAAWGKPGLSLKTVEPPTVEERKNAASYAGLVVPGAAQSVIDHNIFLQDEMVETLLEFGQVIRKATNGKRLVCFFYGYPYEFSGINRQSATGHLAMQRLLDSPDIDILCSPVSYFDRNLGGGGYSMTCSESVQRAGKLWLYEDDTRTHLAAGGSLASLSYHAPDQWSSKQILLRNTGEEIIRNYACWWMDLINVGWYNDPELWTIIRDLKEMEEKKLARPEVYKPSIAHVFDEISARYTISLGKVSSVSNSFMRRELARVGASYGQYYLEDILRNGVDASMVILANAWVLDDAQRERLQAVLKDKFALWVHAPGIMDPAKGVVLERSKALTGYGLTPLKGVAGTVTATARGRELGLPERWTVGAAPELLFSVEAAGGDVLATWPDGSAAVVLKEKSLFSASPELPRELLALALKRAGIHRYTEDGCVLYTDEKNVLVHATREGDVTLRFPKASVVYDVMTGNALSQQAVSSLRLSLKFGETRILELRDK